MYTFVYFVFFVNFFILSFTTKALCLSAFFRMVWETCGWPKRASDWRECLNSCHHYTSKRSNLGGWVIVCADVCPHLQYQQIKSSLKGYYIAHITFNVMWNWIYTIIWNETQGKQLEIEIIMNIMKLLSINNKDSFKLQTALPIHNSFIPIILF